jgi:two-component system, chemotaxis family, chemotaxis protein CheY
MKSSILVIDDDATIRFLLKSILKEYEVITMEDGFEALDWLNSGNVPDLILLDLEMPNINGRVLIRRLKSSYKHRNVPIVIMSGTDSKLIKNSFLKLGASDFIIKPFTDSDFQERIKSAMIIGG